MAKSRKSTSKKDEPVMTLRQKLRKAAGIPEPSRRITKRRSSSRKAGTSKKDSDRSDSSRSSSRSSDRSRKRNRSSRRSSRRSSGSRSKSSPSRRSSSESERSSSSSSSRSDPPYKAPRVVKERANSPKTRNAKRSPDSPKMVRRSIRIERNKHKPPKPVKKEKPKHVRSKVVYLTPEESAKLTAVLNNSFGQSKIAAVASPGTPSLNGSVSNAPGNNSVMNISKIPSTTNFPHSPNSQSGRTSTPLVNNGAQNLYRASILNRVGNTQAVLPQNRDAFGQPSPYTASPLRAPYPASSIPGAASLPPGLPSPIPGTSSRAPYAAPPASVPTSRTAVLPPGPTANVHVSTPTKAANLSRTLTGPSDVRCNLQLPLFIDSVQSIRVSPKNKEIIIETKTILVSKETTAEDAGQLYTIQPTVDHTNIEKEKGQNEEISENRVLVGKNTVLLERRTVIKKSQLQENLSAQTKKEHNHIGTCKVDESTGPLSIHCAQGTVVNGNIYQKKELISMFLTTEPISLNSEQISGILSRRLIREEIPELGQDTIKSEEKMKTTGKYILTLERDVRIMVTPEMWSKEDEYVTTEKRSFEFGKDQNGDVTILERSHQVSKSILELNPSFHNRSTLPPLSCPYDSSVYSTPQAKIANGMNTPTKDKTAQTILQKKTPKNEKESSGSPERKKIKIESPVSKDSSVNVDIPPTKRVLFPSNDTAGTLPNTPNRMEKEQNPAEAARSATSANDPNFRIATTPTAVAASQSPFMLTRSLQNATTPKTSRVPELQLQKTPETPELQIQKTPESASPRRKRSDVESRRDHKKSAPIAVECPDKIIDISKNESANPVFFRKIPMEIVAKINEETYKMTLGFNIKNDSKDINFAAKKITVDGKVLWQEGEENVASNSKQNN